MSSIAAWGLYCVLVAVLFGAAAWAGESALRRVGRAGRWAWFAALAGSLLVPAGAYFLPTLWERNGPGIPEGVVVALPAIGVVADSGGFSVSRAVLAAWIVASVVVLAWVVLSLLRLALARRGWRRAEVDGVRVFVSSDVGPAVFAAGRSSIVVPEWALELDDRFRRLMLLHEAEHARAGDPALLLFALVLVALMPWNPALWWQLRRLRMAVEVDCDARVVAATGDARTYGTLLLEVGRRRSGGRLLVAFSEPRSFLERRIRAIAAGVRGRGVRRALAPAVVGAVAVIAAVCARDPSSPGNPIDGRVVVPDGEPTIQPYTVRPRILNGDEVAQALKDNYPPLLRDAGIGGTAEVWFYIDDQGQVTRVQINRSSGYEALDRAALSLAEVFRFSPALNHDEPVDVWVTVPITFTAPSQNSTTAEVVDPVPVQQETQEPTNDPPRFTPFTQRPRILNADEVRQALTDHYPPLLRDAGIGGTAEVWVYVDADGTIQRTQINKTSGYDALDRAALQVVPTMRLSPALNRDEAVGAWLSIPVTFGPSASNTTSSIERALPVGEERDVAVLPEGRTDDISRAPVFTPMTVRPRIVNASEVNQALTENYPPLLRDAGIGGTAHVWFFIDADGTVQKTQIQKSSGHDALDQAALRVAETIRLSPAENHGQPVAVWVSVPITFSSN